MLVSFLFKNKQGKNPFHSTEASKCTYFQLKSFFKQTKLGVFELWYY